MKNNNLQEKLKSWQEKYETAKSAYTPVLDGISEYCRLLDGTREVKGSENSKKASVVRNIVYELIEAQVDSGVPQPKITAAHPGMTGAAVKLENKLRNELDRLPFEAMNDRMERLTPSCGGSYFMVEWDSGSMTRSSAGELSVSVLAANQVIPQPGVYEIGECDYLFVRLSRTREYVRSHYGIYVNEGEAEPDIRSEKAELSSDKVTQIVCYYRNSDGGIGKFSWVGDYVTEDIESYQHRILKRCSDCGEVCEGSKCVCGGTKLYDSTEKSETLPFDVPLSDGSVARAGEAVPYYVPDVYPIVLRRNVSKLGMLLGESDVRIIADQQDIIKKIETDAMEKMIMGGSVFVKPRGVRVSTDDTNMRVVEFDTPAQADMLRCISLQPDISKNLTYAEEQYQRARQLLGITDSYQGRADSTATSGKAKEFAAKQSAGRLESKRVMKNSAFAQLFEVMAKFIIAYTDEPRAMIVKSGTGEMRYDVFCKYDFLCRDASGELYYNLDFMFATDAAATLAANREAMWQETRKNLKDGALGNPTDVQTLIMFWRIMEGLHYPGADAVRKSLEERAALEMQNAKFKMQNDNPSGRTVGDAGPYDTGEPLAERLGQGSQRTELN